MTEEIKVWAFHNAPEELRTLSDNGGDEDWLVFIPLSLVEETLLYGTPSWIYSMDATHEPQRWGTWGMGYDGVVFIGSHS